jgi:hypothetical protein
MPDKFEEPELPDHPIDILLHRLPSFSTMTWDLWLITGTLWGQLLAAAFLLVIGVLASRRFEIVSIEGESARMPIFAFWAAFVFLLLAWTFLLAGALEARSAGMLILIAFCYASTGFRLSTLSRWRFTMLGVLWMVTVILWWAQWRNTEIGAVVALVAGCPSASSGVVGCTFLPQGSREPSCNAKCF